MWTPEELKEIIDKYNRGEDTGYSDEEYDRLLEEYMTAHGGESIRPYTRNKQTDAVNNLVCTLPKTYGVNVPMREGQKTYRDWITTKKITPEQPILIQPKYDGCSVAFDFKSQRFFTRGDYENGESVDVTELFADRIDWLNRWKEREDRCCPWNPTGLKFEAILDVESYDHYNRTHPDNQYKRPRDYVAAAMTSRDVEMCKKISLLSLRALAEDGREYIPQMLWNNSVYSSAHNFERIEQFIKDCLSNNATYNTMLDCEIDVDENYKIDGVVVSVCLDEPGEECFIDGDNEVAIKILKDVKQTKLRDIIWQIGKTGKITPVARLQPVKFDNITVDHVTLSTFDRVMQMDLRYDDTVDIMYNIVPYFVGSHHDGSLNIPIPKNCPTCGQPLNTLMKTVRCLNPNCPSVIIGGIVRYCEKMKMMGISDGIIRDLYDCHLVESIPDLYGINTGQIAYLDGYGDKAEANIINSIWKASEDVELHKWFGAMPINDISDKTWKIIFDTIFQRDMNVALSNMADWVKDHDKEPLLDTLIIYGNKFPNIGSAKLRSIVQGIYQNWDLICKTFPYIKFKVTPNMDNIKGTVSLTGTRDQGITAALTQHGWLVTDFNTKVNLLVIPNPSFTSHKTELAKKHNIPIRTIEETYDMLGMKGMNENG
jgi:NAD-dependent DNA ligase